MPASVDPRVTAFGRAVRKARRDRDLSQEALAGRAGVHPTHISAIERAMKDVQISTAFRVADGLGMTPGELFTRIDDQGGS